MTDFSLPWERVQWRTRHFAVTDFRFVLLRRGRVTEEIALHDIGSIHVDDTTAVRLTGVGDVLVRPARSAREALRLRHVWRARQVAMRLTLLIADLRGIPPDEEVAKLPLPSLWRIGSPMRFQAAFMAPSFILLTLVAIVIGLSGHEVRVAYGPDDPVRPNGRPRSREEIAAFMEAEVLPWARGALEPVVGRGRVNCETCHGPDPEERNWKMPAVRALPEPAVLGMADAAGSDSQMRNALHGYLAEEDNQAAAAHMRGVVVPGMARLLRRPAYDFAQTYEFNRARAAVGCYHCHQVGGP
jgi:hypothetical protein